MTKLPDLFNPKIHDICPVCDGHGYYLITKTNSIESPKRRNCRVCKQKGFIKKPKIRRKELKL